MLDIFKKRKQEKFQNHKNAAETAYYSNQDKASAVQELELALKIRPDCYETWCQYRDWCDALASEHMNKEEMDKFAMLREKAEQAIRKSNKLPRRKQRGIRRALVDGPHAKCNRCCLAV